MTEQIDLITSVSIVDDDIVAPKKENVTLKTTYTMLFEEEMVVKRELLDRATRMLLGYLANTCPDRIVLEETFYHEYGKFLSSQEHDPYTNHTVYICLRKLVTEGFVLQTGTNVYKLNPRFYYRGDPKLRAQYVKDTYEIAAMYAAKKEKRKLSKQIKQDETQDTTAGPVPQSNPTDGAPVPIPKEQAINGDTDFSLSDIQF